MISIIIPTLNGRDYMERTLGGIYSQRVSEDFEVIVVDSSSVDDTMSIVRENAVRYNNIREYMIPKNEFNHGETRNFAASKARGEYLVFMSQDAIPADDRWLERLVDVVRSDEQVAGAYSRQIAPDDATPFEVRYMSNMFPPIKKVKSVEYCINDDYYFFLDELVLFSNVSSCIRRRVWEEIPFKEIDFGEDQQWARRALDTGYRIVYEPSSVVEHYHRFTLDETLKAYFTAGRVFKSEVLYNEGRKGKDHNPLMALLLAASNIMPKMISDYEFISRYDYPLPKKIRLSIGNGIKGIVSKIGWLMGTYSGYIPSSISKRLEKYPED